MAEEALVLALVEVAKIGLSAYFQAMRAAGKTTEEMDVMFKEQHEMFLDRTPAILVDV